MWHASTANKVNSSLFMTPRAIQKLNGVSNTYKYAAYYIFKMQNISSISNIPTYRDFNFKMSSTSSR